MIAYTILAAEFLTRFYLQKPFEGRESVEVGSPTSDKWKMGTTKSGAIWLPRRLSLMILGLALSTIFVFLRFDASS